MERYLLVRLITGADAAWFFIAAVFIGMAPMLVWSQTNIETDFESPIIEHQPRNGGVIGDVEIFGATVVDNEAIASVTLFYRFSGETEFASLVMREVAKSSFYSAKVDTANVPIDAASIEYYIQAEDIAGNLTLKGFAFQPLIRMFTEPSAAATQPAVPQHGTENPIIRQSGVNWVYVAVGALLVAGIAAAAGSSDDGSSQDCEGGCTLTLTFDRPAGVP